MCPTIPRTKLPSVEDTYKEKKKTCVCMCVNAESSVIRTEKLHSAWVNQSMYNLPVTLLSLINFVKMKCRIHNVFKENIMKSWNKYCG